MKTILKLEELFCLVLAFYLFLALLTVGACGLIIQHEAPRAWRAWLKCRW